MLASLLATRRNAKYQPRSSMSLPKRRPKVPALNTTKAKTIPKESRSIQRHYG
ncbi:hypothetical protein A2U01_0064165, partial [Trifolium medium]|nr:hypothetical protein [Trifolium medium]